MEQGQGGKYEQETVAVFRVLSQSREAVKQRLDSLYIHLYFRAQCHLTHSLHNLDQQG